MTSSDTTAEWIAASSTTRAPSSRIACELSTPVRVQSRTSTGRKAPRGTDKQGSGGWALLLLPADEEASSLWLMASAVVEHVPVPEAARAS